MAKGISILAGEMKVKARGSGKDDQWLGIKGAAGENTERE